MSRALYEKLNPFRSPAWRWERVLEMVSHRPAPLRASRSDDDRYIRVYRKFLVRLQGRESRTAQMALFDEAPALYFAHLFYHNPDKEFRDELQARILSGQTDKEIGLRQFGTLPEAITWYGKLFFDVRDRLANTSYIRKVIVGRWAEQQPAADGSITFYQVGMMLKMFSYYGGPFMLQYVLERMRGLGKAYKDTNCDGWTDDVFCRAARSNSAAAMQTFSFNKYTIHLLFETHLKLIELDRMARMGGGNAPIEYQRNVEEMLKAIPWTIGDRGHKGKNKLEKKYDESAVEPRAAEALQLAGGIEPPSLAEVQTLELRMAAEK